MCQSKLSRTESINQINKLGVIFPSSGLESRSQDSRLQAGPGACLGSSSASTASEQRTHCLNLDLLPHSFRRCSIRLAISTTCVGGETKRSCTVSIKSVKDSQLYLFAFIAVSQHGTVCPVVQIQAFICEGLIRFTAEYAQTEAKTLWSNLLPQDFPV